MAEGCGLERQKSSSAVFVEGFHPVAQDKILGSLDRLTSVLVSAIVIIIH
jgi:hypothetical protein